MYLVPTYQKEIEFLNSEPIEDFIRQEFNSEDFRSLCMKLPLFQWTNNEHLSKILRQ